MWTILALCMCFAYLSNKANYEGARLEYKRMRKLRKRKLRYNAKMMASMTQVIVPFSSLDTDSAFLPSLRLFGLAGHVS